MSAQNADTLNFDDLVKSQMETMINKLEIKNQRITASVLPGLSYSPECAWEFGFVSGVSIKPRDSVSMYYRPSSISSYFSYSTKHWFTAKLKVDTYNSNGFNYSFTGRFMNTPNTFYGIGNNYIPDTTSEFTFRNLELNGRLAKNFINKIFIGTEVDLFDAQTLSITDSVLNSDIVGYDGGISIGLGLFVNFDTRDNINYPYRGIFCSLGATSYPKFLPNDFDFQRYTFTLSIYRKIISDLVMCINTRIALSEGEVPFYKMPQLAGNEYLRGISNRYKYIDNNCAYAQIELRKHIWWRIGASAFGGLGNTFHDIDQATFNHSKWVSGIGLRFAVAEKERLNFRIDLGFGTQHDHGVYMSLKEAF